MLRLLVFSVFVISQTSILGCQKNKEASEPSSLFDSIPVVKAVAPTIAEASGIADSRKNKGYIWVQEDSGNPSQLYLLGHDGKVAKTIRLEGIVNRDWEELQLSGNELYLADIGDNSKRYTEYRIHVFGEPLLDDEKVSNIQTLRYTYKDGPRDAEAFLVDAETKDIYIITKSDDPSKIYKLTAPFNYAQPAIAKSVGAITYSGVVGAAISPDGKDIIVKTYTGLRLYTKTGSETISQTLQKPFKLLPYVMEPQGEAVTFSITNNGYFTLSEKGFFNATNLYFYKRK